MAFRFGGKIITDGLLIHLDAGLYTSPETIWNDTGYRKLTYSLINGPTYDSSNGGSIVFDGTDDYVQPNINFTTGNGTRTLFFFIKSTDGSTTIRGIIGERASSTGWGVANNYGSIGRLYYFHPGGAVIDTSGGYDVPTNQWCSYAITYDSPTGIIKLYKNGIYVKESTGNIDGTTTTGTKLSIAAGTGHGYFQGNIGVMQYYNRVLSADEVYYNFSFYKSRFGL